MAWANPFKVLKTVNTPKAGWVDRVREAGLASTATVTSKPDAVTEMEKVGRYAGHDAWIDVDVRVTADDGPPFEAKAKVTLGTAMGGLIEAGTSVNVRYDPEARDHVVIVDDVQTLLQKRIMRP